MPTGKNGDRQRSLEVCSRPKKAQRPAASVTTTPSSATKADATSRAGQRRTESTSSVKSYPQRRHRRTVLGTSSPQSGHILIRLPFDPPRIMLPRQRKCPRATAIAGGRHREVGPMHFSPYAQAWLASDGRRHRDRARTRLPLPKGGRCNCDPTYRASVRSARDGKGRARRSRPWPEPRRGARTRSGAQGGHQVDTLPATVARGRGAMARGRPRWLGARPLGAGLQARDDPGLRAPAQAPCAPGHRSPQAL